MAPPMARPPEERVSPEFRQRVTAQPGDIDELRHVANIVYVRWIQEVAVAHSAAVGWNGPAYLAAGRIFVVRRHEIEYFAPSLVGEELELITWIESWSAASSVRRTKVVRVRDQKDLVKA